MLPENAAVLVTDVLNFHQKRGHFKVSRRSFSAISLRLNANGKYIFNNKTLSFKPPSICVIPAGVDYQRSSLDDEVLVIHFHLLNAVMEDIQVYKIADTEQYRRLFEKALQIRRENAPGAQYLETAVLYEIFGALAREAGLLNTAGGSIAESAEYMKQNFFNPALTVEALAERAHVCPAQYRRKFRQLYGESPKQRLDSLRFQYAKALLETGYFSQKEIASRCGFSDVAYFRTAFKKKTGKCIRDYCAEEIKQPT